MHRFHHRQGLQTDFNTTKNNSSMTGIVFTNKNTAATTTVRAFTKQLSLGMIGIIISNNKKCCHRHHRQQKTTHPLFDGYYNQ
jgi:hypothetical protein